MALGEDIAENAAEPWIAARDWAVLLLLYGAGLRIGEAMALSADILPLGETIRVLGKRGKTRMVPLLPELRTAIEEYARQSPYPLIPSEPLFRGRRAGRCRLRSFGGRFRRRASGWGWVGGRRPMRCVTASPPICWGGGGSPPATRAIGSRQPQLDANLHGGRCRASARHLSHRTSPRLRRLTVQALPPDTPGARSLEHLHGIGSDMPPLRRSSAIPPYAVWPWQGLCLSRLWRSAGHVAMAGLSHHLSDSSHLHGRANPFVRWPGILALDGRHGDKRSRDGMAFHEAAISRTRRGIGELGAGPA